MWWWWWFGGCSLAIRHVLSSLLFAVCKDSLPVKNICLTHPSYGCSIVWSTAGWCWVSGHHHLWTILTPLTSFSLSDRNNLTTCCHTFPVALQRHSASRLLIFLLNVSRFTARSSGDYVNHWWSVLGHWWCVIWCLWVCMVRLHLCRCPFRWMRLWHTTTCGTCFTSSDHPWRW